MGLVSTASSDSEPSENLFSLSSSMGSQRAGVIIGGFGDAQAEPEPNNNPARVSLNGVCFFLKIY